MVDVQVSEGKLVLHVRGADQLWALRSTLEIPLEHIAGARADPEVARGWWHGVRLPGTFIPGVITAGTFYQHGQRVFWDVHHPDNTIVIDLHDERYNELIVEVENPAVVVEMIQAQLAGK
ncbi:MAG TPA: hypothetical protein VMD25_06095 [Acidobacteriaceae bacterium]|nr:hypothetical protein [Acidobacteriaceae bacterium]